MTKLAPGRTAVRSTSVLSTKSLRRPAVFTACALIVLALFATLVNVPLAQAATTNATNSSAVDSTATIAEAPTTKRSKSAKKSRSSKKRKTRLTVRRSASQQIYSTTGVKLKIRANGIGRRAKVKIVDRGKTLAKRTLKPRTASVRLPQKLRVGKHRLKVTVTPSKKAKRSNARAKTKRVSVRVISRRDAIIKAAKKHVGVSYRSGGSTPRGFDCSGFTSYVYDDALDIDLPRSSSSQRYVGKRVSKSRAKPGDIIWTPGHVAIYLGGNKQIDAPRPGLKIHVRSIYQRNPVFISVV